MNAPFRKDYFRMSPYQTGVLDFDYDIKEVQEDGTFKGYASTFGGKPDSHGHVIVEGAFKKTLARGGRNKTGVIMLLGHNPEKRPGVWTDLVEDKKGLFNEGKLMLEKEIGRDTHADLLHKAIQHESIGYDLPRTRTGKIKPSAIEVDEDKNIAYLKEIDLWEISLVPFPANISARVTRVKEILREAGTVRQLEQALRELGLSKSDAQYVAGLCRPSLRDSEMDIDGEGGDAKLVLEALRQFNI